jgi:transposase-like protein
MDQKTFQAWLSASDELTDAQKAEAGEVLAGGPSGAASLAALELAVGEDRRCPHCSTPGAVKRGMARGLRRYRCKACGKSFNALTGTPLSGLKRKDRWLEFGRSLAEGETIKEAAARCGVANSTSFRWRHRFLQSVEICADKLTGIVEADETFVLSSRKGSHAWKKGKEGGTPADPPDRKARKRGGKSTKRGLSDEQVPVLIASDRSGRTISAVLPEVTATAVCSVLKDLLGQDSLLITDGSRIYPPVAKALKVTHEALNQSAGERVRGDLHINTVNNRHSRLKDFLRVRRGIATKYLTSYLKWFHLVALSANPTPRRCIAAAMGA